MLVPVLWRQAVKLVTILSYRRSQKVCCLSWFLSKRNLVSMKVKKSNRKTHKVTSLKAAQK